MTHFLAVFGKSTGNIVKIQLIMQIVSNETCLVVKKDMPRQHERPVSSAIKTGLVGMKGLSRQQERPVLHASKTGLFLLLHPLFRVEACTLFA